MVMYQNEAYSYTPYPGCPWTSDGILRFNLEYLAPTLKAKHPDVENFASARSTPIGMITSADCLPTRGCRITSVA